jgi:hypothetical protein
MKMALNSLSPLVVMMALTDGSLLASCCTAVEWSEILQTKTLLEPIMEIQKYLEGEKYVTVSVVPSLIGIIRRGLTAFLTNDSHSERSKNVCRLMLSSFNTHWGIA